MDSQLPLTEPLRKLLRLKLENTAQFWKQTTEIFIIEISVKKTKSLPVTREPRRCKLAYNQSVKQVMTFKYLGANITSSRNLKEEVKAQTTKASFILGGSGGINTWLQEAK